MSTTKSDLAALLSAPLLQCQKLGYLHTAEEIASQPEIWRATARLLVGEEASLSSFLKLKPRLVLSGAGSSHYVGLSVAPSLRKVFPVAEAIPSTEIVMDPESSLPREDFVLVSFARSGDSPEGIAAVSLAEKLRAGKVRHLAITCNSKGELARIVGSMGERGMVIVLPEGTNDKSLAMTASFSSMLLAGLFLGYAARGEARSFGPVAESLASMGGSILDRFSGVAKSLASEGFRRAFFIASRPFLGGAYEAHLKVQELSGGAILSKAEDTLGLRHGFMAAIDKDSLVVLYLSSDPYRRRYELDLARELRSKGLGKKIVLVTPEGSGCEGLGDVVFETGTAQGTGDESRAILAVLPGQLIGMYCSMALGLKPDAPSPSGVIHRVVEGVKIYPYGESGTAR
jgi:tagatose-6-phosphate ketose/aldose isomerase